MARFAVFVSLALMAVSAQAAQVPVYKAGAFAADSEQAAVAEDVKVDYDYQGGARSMGDDSALYEMEDADRNAFVRLFEKLLWTHATSDVYTDARGFEHQDTKRGLLRMAKPAMLAEEDGFAARMYENTLDRCYTGLCKLGLGGLFASIEEMLDSFL